MLTAHLCPAAATLDEEHGGQPLIIHQGLCINKPFALPPPSHYPLTAPTSTSARAPLSVMLPGDGLLWNAAHGEESRCRGAICHMCLRDGDREANRGVTGLC
ncbi:hypothetical protein ILYODFUR_003647 [Ilyodon furcidens]|uniref:Uncharacterized protein n=1 Tax=Ilyodon furcidens TaxID=33524 RepID=A0ABV0T545_9TELE